MNKEDSIVQLTREDSLICHDLKQGYPFLNRLCFKRLKILKARFNHEP